MSTSVPEAGEEYTYERTFTVAEVREFGELSGDQQAIHTEPNEDGELVVQGLLTATLPTKIGGDLSYLARRMELEFVRPVYTGERITCTLRNESVDERDDRYEIESSVVCTNGDGKNVLEGEIAGLIWKA
ncbi:hotdog family protein [Natronorubrum tibetense]|uniref:MaoC domain-containing protein dehydratase n=1 Tax=Natronorubrum tibetense GA33 TaxID=1114856 RepID=L9VY32_9EURY|nr:MaoC/PaaZ C-terminal domain-containing protein [Natronorubrum tibetense]ELY41932.1 MaoC domain-containing protein dehydratase [Natronorubrum tibetense GA33]